MLAGMKDEGLGSFGGGTGNAELSEGLFDAGFEIKKGPGHLEADAEKAPPLDLDGGGWLDGKKTRDEDEEGDEKKRTRSHGKKKGGKKKR